MSRAAAECFGFGALDIAPGAAVSCVKTSCRCSVRLRLWGIVLVPRTLRLSKQDEEGWSLKTPTRCIRVGCLHRDSISRFAGHDSGGVAQAAVRQGLQSARSPVRRAPRYLYRRHRNTCTRRPRVTTNSSEANKNQKRTPPHSGELAECLLPVCLTSSNTSVRRFAASGTLHPAWSAAAETGPRTRPVLIDRTS